MFIGHDVDLRAAFFRALPANSMEGATVSLPRSQAAEVAKPQVLWGDQAGLEA